MGKQLKNRFTEKEVIDILERYLRGEIDTEATQSLLSLKRRRFFEVLKDYRQDPSSFSLDSPRSKPSRQLPQSAEAKIEQALQQEKLLIQDKNNPIHRYNYSYVKNRLEKENLSVSSQN